MIRKFVNCDKNLVQFFYPEFQVKSYVNFLDRENKVIYIGKPLNNLREYLENNTKEFICLVGFCELDLSTPKPLINYVFTRVNRKLEPHVELYLTNLDKMELEYFLKCLWVTGQFPYQINKSISMLSLYKSLTKSINEIISTLYKLLDIYSFNIIESSFLTFLEKVKNIETVNVSPYYLKILKEAHMTIRDRLKPAVFQYSKSSRKEVDFLVLIMNLKGL